MSTKPCATIAICLAVLLTGCGSACGQVEEYEIPYLEAIADTFEECGYPRPQCPVYFCDYDCPSKVNGFCGVATLDGTMEGCCKEIWVDISMTRAGCKNPARTMVHEWLHEMHLHHGDRMDSERDRILGCFHDKGW